MSRFKNDKEKAQEEEGGKEQERKTYITNVLQPGTSLIIDDANDQKTKFEKEEERLAELVADVSSAQVASDCNTLLADASTHIRDASPDKHVIIGDFDKVKQRLILAYDSRAAEPWFAKLFGFYNFLLLFVWIALIGWFRLIPGQNNLEDTAYVLLACAIWGGVGGTIDAFFALHTHFANQDFDKNYGFWYWAHPTLGLALGAVTFLILQSGLMATSGTPLKEALSDNATIGISGTASTGKIGATALPIALAFLAGFRQRTVVDWLAGIIKAIFPGKSNKQKENK